MNSNRDKQHFRLAESRKGKVFKVLEHLSYQSLMNQVNIFPQDSEMSTLLDEPSRKFFLKDLQSCTEVDRVATSPAADAGKIKSWNFVSRAYSVHFCITWIQGVVVKVSDSIVQKRNKLL